MQRRANPFRLSRRDFLRGAGAATLALPLFPGLGARAQSGAYPRRVVFLFFTDGIQPDYWWPTTVNSPTDYQLGPLSSLQALSAHLNDMTLISGLEHRSTYQFTGAVDLHDYVMKHVLTGGPNSPAISFNGITTPGGASMDYLLSQHMGVDPRRRYLFGVRADTNTFDQRVLSFTAKDQGVEAESNPITVLQDLFGGVWPGDTWVPANIDQVAQGSECSTRDTGAAGMIVPGPASQMMMTSAPKDTWRLNLVDKLRDEYTRIRCMLGQEDKLRLDVHIQGLQQIEQQLTLANSGAGGGLPVIDGCYKALVDRTPAYIDYNEWFDDGSRIQIALLTGAFASDVTRVATLQYGASRGSMAFPYLDIRADLKDKDLQYLSHMQDPASTSDESLRLACKDAVRLVNTWRMQQIELLVSSLKGVPEGSGTLFDNTTIVVVSDMGYGMHLAYDLPVLVIGTAGGALKKGMFLDIEGTGQRRPFTDLLITIANAHGVGITQFGEQQINDVMYGQGMISGSTGPITELLA